MYCRTDSQRDQRPTYYVDGLILGDKIKSQVSKKEIEMLPEHENNKVQWDCIIQRRKTVYEVEHKERVAARTWTLCTGKSENCDKDSVFVLRIFHIVLDLHGRE